MSNTNFIENKRSISLTDLQIFYCSFSLNKFNNNLFSLCDIKKPASIENSILKRRAEFFAGRYCAKNLLKNNRTESDVAIGKNGMPIWPDGIVGSISHCEQNAVAAIAKNSDCYYVGIDIEKVISHSTVESISYQIVNSAESELISAYQDKQAYLFTLFFSLKESFFKAVYPTLGFYFDFDAVSIFDVNLDEKALKFKINYTLSNEFSEGKIFKGRFINVADDIVLTFFTL